MSFPGGDKYLRELQISCFSMVADTSWKIPNEQYTILLWLKSVISEWTYFSYIKKNDALPGLRPYLSEVAAGGEYNSRLKMSVPRCILKEKNFLPHHTLLRKPLCPANLLRLLHKKCFSARTTLMVKSWSMNNIKQTWFKSVLWKDMIQR